MTDPLVRETDGRVRVITLARPDEYNTINPALRDALAAALDDADRDRAVHAVLLRAEGPAFCAGYQLDWATAAQAEADASSRRVWDSVADVRMIGQYAAGVGQAAHDLEADDRGRARLVHRGRHQHGAQRGSDRVQRVGAVRLSADRACGESRRRRGCGSHGWGWSAPSGTCSPATR